MMNKNVYYLGVVSFFTDFASAMITPILPIFIVYVLHDGMDRLGVIIAISTFVSYFFRILFGYLSDRFQVTKPFLVFGYFISAVTKPLYSFSSSYQSIAAIKSMERMGKAIRTAPKDALISHYSKTKESGKTFGFHKTMDIAGELLGTIVIFCILYFYGESEDALRNIFLLTVIPGIIGVLVLLLFVEDMPYKQKNERYQFQKADYKLFPTLFIYFCFIFFILSDSFFIIVVKEAGYLTTYIPLFIIASTLTQTLSSYYIGVMSDKKGSQIILNISYLFGILSILSLLFGFLWLGFIFLGIFTVSSLNAIRSYISYNAINKASIYGLFYAGIALFASLGALNIGYIWQNFGKDNALAFSLFGTIIVLFFSLLKSVRR